MKGLFRLPGGIAITGNVYICDVQGVIPMNKRSGIFLSYGFIAALVMLLLNDLALKYSFHNFFTGKLSDLAGLFIFPLFFTVLFPGKKKMIFIITAVLFVFWKSSASQAIIDGWNSIGAFRIVRTVDYYDLSALAVLPFSYRFKGNHKLPVRLLRIPVMLAALFAFCSTSYDRSIEVNKTYTLNMPKEELIARINSIGNGNGCHNMIYSFDIEKADTMLAGYGDTSWISYTSSTIRKDTLYKYNRITDKPTDEIDTIYQYFIPVTDTTFIKDNKAFALNIPASRYMHTDTASYCNCVETRVSIAGNGSTSRLTLKNVYINYCMGGSGKKEREKLKAALTMAFEKEYIDRIK
ncbi:MAG: hypothetical protein WCM76_07915 [Bacteroidota bacterium]